MKKRLLLMLALLVSAASFSADSVSIVGGFVGWNGSNAVAMTESSTAGVFKLNYTFTSSTSLKFIINGNWFGNTTFPSGLATGTANGQDIPVPAGTYDITIDLSDSSYSFVVGIPAYPEIKLTGTASPISSTMSTTDGITYKVDSATLVAGNGKFTQTGSSNAWGLAVFPSGTATLGGANIPILNGTYNILFNKTTGAFTFTITPIGIVGSLTSWGSNPDIMMTSADGVNYTYSGLVVPANNNELKFRDNSGWGFNYGAVDNTPAYINGTGILNSNKNIFVPEGTYDVAFNRSTLAYTFTSTSFATKYFESTKFSVYPNPTVSNWTIESKNDISDIQISDANGKIVKSSKPSASNVNVDASTLETGIYFVKITSGTATETLKLIRN
jgi:starch-binding outer membrane protein SusE/F